MKTGCILPVLLLAAMVMVPACAAMISGKSGEVTDGKNISIKIIAPTEGQKLYIDVVPAYVSIRGTIDAPYGIQNVSIDNGEETVVCGKNYGTSYNFSCNVQGYSNIKHITVTVIDKSGNIASESRNFSIYAGPPPPGSIPGFTLPIAIFAILMCLVFGSFRINR